MKIERFEDIKSWQEARELVKLVYEAIRKNKIFGQDFRLVNQLQGSAVSIMANIAEGFSRQSDKEFVQYLFVSKASAAEVQSHLYVALDQKYICQKRFDDIYNKADSISRMNSNFIKYLKNNTNKKRCQMNIR